MKETTAERIFDAVTEDRTGESDLSDKAKAVEPKNFLRHLVALSFSKISDGLIDPKLVLSWLLVNLGAGAFWVGLLVPVREAGALLPQLFTAPYIGRAAIRKWFWAGGALVQGVMAGAIAWAALTQEGQAAGLTIVACLAVLAVARSVCSASYKDVLGKTVERSRRGTATGFASSASAAGVIVFALVLLSGWEQRYTLVIAAIALAACLWVGAAAVFATMREFPSEGRDTSTPAQFRLLAEDPQLTRFILVRSLLVGTALAPPYLVALQPENAIGQLGGLVLASALASLLSSYVWGRLSDRSSRRVLLLAGLAGGAVLAALALLALAGAATMAGLIPAALFGVMIAHHGVRQGRATHLVDMADADDRASYTALSNTVVGLVLMGAGAVSAALAAISLPLVIGLFAAMCFAAAVAARGLDEVQNA